jgi:hypothetical protein
MKHQMQNSIPGLVLALVQVQRVIKFKAWRLQSQMVQATASGGEIGYGKGASGLVANEGIGTVQTRV